MMLRVATRSGALSTSVPSRSKTTVGATIHDRYPPAGGMARRRDLWPASLSAAYALWRKGVRSIFQLQALAASSEFLSESRPS